MLLSTQEPDSKIAAQPKTCTPSESIRKLTQLWKRKKYTYTDRNERNCKMIKHRQRLHIEETKTYIYFYIYIYIHTHTHIYIYTHTHTHIHIYINNFQIFIF